MKSNLLWKGIPMALYVSFPLAFFCYTFSEMAVNVPFQDDFDALLEPTIKLTKGYYSGFAGFWNILYTQDDERRIVVDRLLSYLIYLIYGELDLRIMMGLSILMYITLLGLYFRWFMQEKISYLYYLPIPLLLLTPLNYGAIFWSMIPMQHIAVFIWTFLALWLLSRSSVNLFILGVVVSIITLYSDVSGTFIVIPGALSLFIQKKYKRLAVWSGVIGVLVACYYYDLKVPDFRPTIGDNLRNFKSLLQILITMPGMIVDLFPFLSPDTRLLVAGIAGIAGLLVVLYFFVPFLNQYLMKRQIPSDNDVWIWCSLAFLFVIFGVFALGRASEGAVSILISRYKHMFVYWSLFTYLLFLKTTYFRINKIKVGLASFGVGLIFFVNAYFQNWEDIDFYRKVLLTDAYEWKYNRAIPSSPVYQIVSNYVDDIYEESISTGIYKMPAFYFDSLIKAPIRGTTPVTVENGRQFIAMHLPEISRGFNKNEGAYVLLQAGSDIHIFPTKNSHRSMLGVLRTGTYYNNGAVSIPILKKYLKHPQYDLYVGIISDGRAYRLKTGKRITI